MERTETLTSATAPTRELPGGYIDWAAVLGGAVVAAAIGGLFHMFGAGLGMATISFEPGEGSFSLMLIVTGLWMVVTLIASFLTGGYIAGRMRRRVDDATADEVAARDGINGLVVWGAGMLVMAWMAMGAFGAIAVGAGNVADTALRAGGAAVSGGAGAAGAAVDADADNEAVSSWISDSLLRTTPTAPAPAPAAGTASPAATTSPASDTAEIDRQTAAIILNGIRTGDVSDSDRSYLVAAVSQRGNLSQDEAEARVDEAIAAVQNTRAEAEAFAAEAEATAREAAETARIGAILTAFALTAAALVAGAAAVAGAVRGGRHRDEGRLFGGLTYRL
ncbi:hypothetical protein [Pseudotabrizicola alkalilacus]|uniref:PhnA-like protein n=1 Tax=Pseudotabrizicola alkalilacus TaxID=2305252 RepID=A0A411Z080_9RHOB|nr:hypothetical protein [Pseudotabrizicola alkalilacus]RGP36460.1 hypothetical protein D1012_14815 [Pseudotabrizicola alkalilacus]